VANNSGYLARINARVIWFVPEITGSIVPLARDRSFRINCPMDNLITVVTRFQLPDGVAPMIREKFHGHPTIEFYGSPLIVEN
jgi:hypothetical protein